MTIIIPKPEKPWQASPIQSFATFGPVFGAALISFSLVSITELKGKLAYFIVFFLAFLILSFIQQSLRMGLPAGKDTLLGGFAVLGITLTMIPIISIVSTVYMRGRKGLHWGLFTNDMSMATPNDPITNGGLLHSLLGTLIIVGCALIISFPIGILTALYLTEIRGIFQRPIKFLVQAMSGVPSIVAGLFILSSIVYPITKQYSGFMGSLALSILMIPTIARTSEEVLNLIPNELREAGVALGATQWRAVAMVVVPAAQSGLVTAIILGVARVVGETAPLLLLTGGGDSTNLNPFEGSMGSLPFYVWKAFLVGGTEESLTRAWAGLFVLLMWVLLLFAGARYLSSRKAK